MTDLDLLRARIAEAEVEHARLFEMCDDRFRHMSARGMEEGVDELDVLFARAEAARDLLLELQNELRRALGQKARPR